ncbi:putative F-box/FBD/LRR-repeat protein [Raphanus sativus]|nr:putative F-box/FBD/LRR-repeat protein [Raphanus sativus]
MTLEKKPILFNLPTKDVVKASLLCRRWRDLWQSVLGLDLEFNGSTDFDKYGFFNRFIDVNSDVCLQRIKLQYVRYEENSYNETTIDTAIKQKTRHLDVGSRSHRIRIPPTIYTSCERLVSLKLYRAILATPPKSVSLPCLKIMDLQQIALFDRLAMDMLISLCPVLETLTLDMLYGVKVSSPSLLSFCLIKRVCQIPQVMQLQTPRLKYLKLYGHHAEKIIMNDLSSIVKLDLVGLIISCESYPNFLTLISRVRDLTISADILAVNRKFSKSESIPQKLHKLSVLSVKAINGFGFWEHLLVFLEKCPNLKTLVMEFQDNHYGLNFFDVPRCVLSSLEFVEVRAKHKADMVKIGSYFMANSTALKKFTLRLDQIEEEHFLILNELFALPRQSMGCEVFVRCRAFVTCKPFSLFTYADGFSG